MAVRQIKPDLRSLADLAANDDCATGLLGESVNCERPSLVPLSGLFVVKNGSKIFGNSWGGIPEPVSLIVSAANSPLRESTDSSPRSVTFLPAMVIEPPSGMASRALTTRLTNASSNSAMSIETGQMSRGISVRRSILPRAELASTSWNAAMVWPKCTVRGFCGWRREKVSNCRVSASPREAAVKIASSERIFFWSVIRRMSDCACPLTTISRLLKSCATPPVS